jgi:DNA-binding FadR family transcriptional regulator
VEKEAHRIGEFFEIRRLVEGWCVAQAARQARPADLATMREKLDQMKALELTDPRWEQNDVEFHLAIARSTRNPMAVRMMEVLRETFGALYRLRRVANKLESKPLIWKHHWAIYDAIRRGSPGDGTRAIVAHMDYVERKLEASVHKIKS